MFFIKVKSVALVMAGCLCVTAIAVYQLTSIQRPIFWLVPWGMMMTCILIGIFAQRRLTRILGRYNGVKIIFLMEGHHVWSSHIGGQPRLCSNLFGRLFGKRPRGIKLFDNKVDRDKVNELSLCAFETMLDELSVQPGAVLISASVLNARNSQRLADRVRAVENRTQWQYRYISRRLGLIETVIGGWMYAWTNQPGESRWIMFMPGIVAWRAQDSEPGPEQISRLRIDAESESIHAK